MKVKFQNDKCIGVTIRTEDDVWDMFFGGEIYYGDEVIGEVRIMNDDRIEADVYFMKIVTKGSEVWDHLKKTKKIFAWEDLLLMNKTLIQIMKTK